MAAFTLNSATNATASTVRGLFDFLSDFKNFKHILPEDKVENFQCSEENCSFNIRGITPMTITIKEKNPFHFIIFSSDGLAKFNFSLKVIFRGEADQKGRCSIELTGDLNPFIKTMAEKPLTALVDTMSTKLAALQLN